MTWVVLCPRCRIYCGQWEHAGWNFWCDFCGMDPLVEGPPPPPTEFEGLAGIVAAANARERPQMSSRRSVDGRNDTTLTSKPSTTGRT